MEQRKPVKNDNPAIVDLVIEDMKARQAVGIERYGTSLQAFNGRNSLRDSYEEALDLAQYFKQWQIEREEMVHLINSLANSANPGSFYDLKVKAKKLLESLGEA